MGTRGDATVVRRRRPRPGRRAARITPTCGRGRGSARRAGDRAEQRASGAHRRRRLLATSLLVSASAILTARRGLLLLVTVALGAVVLAACLPRRRRAHHDHAPGRSLRQAAGQHDVGTTATTTTRPATTTTAPSGGAWAQNGPLGAAPCSRRQRLEPRRLRSPVDTNSKHLRVTALGGNQNCTRRLRGAYGIRTSRCQTPLVPVDFGIRRRRGRPDPAPAPVGWATPIFAVVNHCLRAVAASRAPAVGRPTPAVFSHVGALRPGLDVGRRRPDLQAGPVRQVATAHIDHAAHASRCRSRSRPIYRDAPRRRTDEPPPMGCACGSRRASTSSFTGARGARRAQG